MVRRILILIIYVSEYTNVPERTYGILVVSMLILVLHTCLLPFKDPTDNVLETLSLTMLTYAAATKAMFPDGGEITVD